MPTEKPLRPEGCVWGPWWDEGTKCWVCLVNDDRGLMILYWNGKIWFPSADHSRAHAELLRLAAENQALKAFIRETADCVATVGPEYFEKRWKAWMKEARDLVGEE